MGMAVAHKVVEWISNRGTHGLLPNNLRSWFGVEAACQYFRVIATDAPDNQGSCLEGRGAIQITELFQCLISDRGRHPAFTGFCLKNGEVVGSISLILIGIDHKGAALLLRDVRSAK